MLKKRPFLFHILFWLGIYLLWVLIFRSYSVSLTKTITVEFCYLLFITADYYLISHWVIPQFLFKRRHILFILGTLFVIGFSSWCRSLVAMQMSQHFFHDAIQPEFDTLYLHSTINISFWVLLVTIGRMMMENMQTQRLLEVSEKEKIENELNFLKAQINPHALFNSLNTIYGLIDKSNQVAKNTLLQFSELLRYQLYDCSAEKVGLEKELMYLKNYVSFQQLRKSDNLSVQLDISPADPDLKIAPLLMVVLIENAFKHVSNFSDQENKIQIQVAVENAQLNFSIINTTEATAFDLGVPIGGIGITNLKRRLALLYPDKHEISCNQGHSFYHAKMTLQLV